MKIYDARRGLLSSAGHAFVHPGRIRVIAQLIDAGGDTHLWAGSFEHPAAGTLTIQAALADAIARGVNGAVAFRLAAAE